MNVYKYRSDRWLIRHMHRALDRAAKLRQQGYEYLPEPHEKFARDLYLELERRKAAK